MSQNKTIFDKKLLLMKTTRFRINEHSGQKRGRSFFEQGNHLEDCVAEEVIKNRKYLYIDINEQSCFRTMNQCESEDEQEEMERVGKKYAINLNDLQSSNYKGINFLHKMRQSNRKQQRALGMVKEELKKSTQRIMQFHPLNHDSTRYVITSAQNNHPKENSWRKTTQYKPRENKLVSLLTNSIVKELSLKRPKFSTIQPDSRGSPERRTERYIQKLKYILPGINTGRRTVAF